MVHELERTAATLFLQDGCLTRKWRSAVCVRQASIGLIGDITVVTVVELCVEIALARETSCLQSTAYATRSACVQAAMRY